MAFLDIALDCTRRGWHVFPCWPRSKRPMTHHGKLDATLDEAQVRAWWAAEPKANPAISCGPSGLCVLDMDEGPVQNADDLDIWITDAGIPPTFAVRTGRRTSKKTGEAEFGVQLYYAGAIPDVGLWKLANGSGQVKSLGGYVMAAGSIHPDSGAQYEVVWDVPIAPTPDVVRGLKTGERESLKVIDGKKIPDGAGRHHAMTSVAGTLRARGLDGAAIYEALIPINPAMCETPIDDDDLKAIAYGVAKRYPAGEPEIEVVIGTSGGRAKVPALPEPSETPAPQFLTLDEFDNVAPPSFLIENFLAKGAIAMLAGPVAQRKTLVAMNVVHALCTGEPLFEYFEVVERPDRIYYLCPEMGAISFVKRLKDIGLRDYIGTTLFCLTMNQPPIKLEALDNLAGSVVVVDTLIRYIDGNENDSEDMRVFAAQCMAMSRAGATVVLLHHSKKGSSGSLDDGLRGSTELAAFVTSCWVTGLKDLQKPYKSQSGMRNVKQRDFESEAFVLNPVEGSPKLIHGGKDEPEVDIQERRSDAADALVRELYQDDPDISVNRLRMELKEAGHGKGTDWVRAALIRAKRTGVDRT